MKKCICVIKRGIVIIATLLGTGFVFAANEPASADKTDKPVYVLDLWDFYEQEGFDSLNKQVNATYFITTLQGIVNRDKPVLFLDASLNMFNVELKGFHNPDRDKSSDFESQDRRWLDWLQSSGLLKGRPIVRITSFKQLASLFAGQVQGLALWDMQTPSSVNLALTAAGCEDLLPLNKEMDQGFLHSKLEATGVAMPVMRDFTGFSAKAKQKGITGKELVYLTILNRYLKTGQANATQLWFNLDAFAFRPPVISYGDKEYDRNRHLGNRNIIQHNGLYNGDYWISKRGLFVDLYPLGGEAPNDDPDQAPGTDLRLWNDILEESYKQRDGKFGLLGGFSPWWVKYTDLVGNTNSAFSTEVAFIALASSYNLWNDGDAAFGLSNGSFYQHLPLPEPREFDNPPVEKPELDQQTIYVCLFMLDYDGSSWLNQMAHAVYDERGDGTVPLNWAINPILADRVPHVFHYLLANRSDRDFFRIGDDGAGYIDPYYLLGKNRVGRVKEDGFEAYAKGARPYLDKLNIDLMGFYITHKEFSKEILEPIAGLTPAGLGLCRNVPFDAVGDVPVHYLQSYHHKQKKAFGEEMLRLFRRADAGVDHAEFHAYRLIVLTPKMISDALSKARAKYPGAKIEFLDAHTFMALKSEAVGVPLSSPWKNKKRLTAAPGETDAGLAPVKALDGHYETDSSSSPAVWRLKPASEGGRYFYFDVDDAFSEANQSAENLRVKISLRCDAPLIAGLQYNGMPPEGEYPKPYLDHPLKQEVLPRKDFTELVFELDRPYFKNRQNAKADFRFMIDGKGSVEVKSVAVQKR